MPAPPIIYNSFRRFRFRKLIVRFSKKNLAANSKQQQLPDTEQLFNLARSFSCLKESQSLIGRLSWRASRYWCIRKVFFDWCLAVLESVCSTLSSVKELKALAYFLCE